MTGILDVLRSSLGLLIPLFFVGFFLATLIAVVHHRNRYVRTTYLAGFLGGLLVLNLLLTVNLLPLVHWHKFSSPQEQSQTVYQFRVVDTEGNELRFEEEAALSGDTGMSVGLLRKKVQNADSPRERHIVMRYLLRSAREHRDGLHERTPSHLVRFPPHYGTWTAWTPDEVETYGRFVGIRLYQINVTTSESGQTFTDRSERVLYDYYEESENGTRESGVSDHSLTDRTPNPPVRPAVLAGGKSR